MNMVLGHVGMGTGEVAPFDAVYKDAAKVGPTEIWAGKVHALVIWGGADISPAIYNEPVGPHTGASNRLSYRDKVEVEACKAAIDVGIPIIGVCRGAQLLCALAGGKLVQDVSGHIGDHMITTNTGRNLVTSSVHHQMMYPWEVQHTLIAWSEESRSRDYVGVDAAKIEKEPEIVYFPKINGLAIQGHPEFMHPKCTFVEYCNSLVREYLL